MVLLAIGIAIYVSLTPFREHELVARGNTAAGIALGGAILALALPLAAMLATSTALLDIAVWGVVALILQLLTLAAVTLAMRNLGALIKADNTAAAIVAGRRPACGRVAQCGGDGTYLTSTHLKLTPDKETLRCWRSCET